MPMKDRRSRRATAPVVPEPKNGSSTRSPALVAATSTRVSRASGFCVGCVFAAPVVLQPFRARADRQEPVGAGLTVVIARLQHLVIEGVALGLGAARRPDHRLMGVGEAPAAEVRHRVGLAPDDVVENPEAQILQNRPDAKDVVVRADDHDGAVRLHRPPGGAEPSPRERVVFGEIGELVPVVVDRVDQALIRPRKSALELQIIGRIGEDEVDRSGREPIHLGDAVADQDCVAGRGNDCGRAFRLAGASTQNLNLGGKTQRSGTQHTHELEPLDSTPGSFEPARRIWRVLSKGLVMRAALTLCRFRTLEVTGREY